MHNILATLLNTKHYSYYTWQQWIMCMHVTCVGVLKSSGDKLTMKFRTSTDKEPKVYTIATMGEVDTTLSLLG